MLLLVLTAAAVLPALCIATDRPADRSNVAITRTDGDAREGYINVTGGRVWFRIVGAESAGTPLLVLHGGPGMTHDYLEPLEALADERPVVFYDQLGCGNSDTPDDPALWTVERYVAEVGEVRDALGLSRVHLLGQSWGGRARGRIRPLKKPRRRREPDPLRAAAGRRPVGGGPEGEPRGVPRRDAGGRPGGGGKRELRLAGIPGSHGGVLRPARLPDGPLGRSA